MSRAPKQTRKAEAVLREVTNYYLASSDFNGLPVRGLIERCSLPLNEVVDVLTALLRAGKISLEFGDRHENPHIKAFAEEAAGTQLEKLQRLSEPAHDSCVYPSRVHLRSVVDEAQYQGRPFTLRLALGEPQLAFESFDLQVLEFYRNDPRYYYHCDDVEGHIGVNDEYHDSGQLPTSDQILLERFGFSYDPGLKRAVAVFLRYLSGLSPEHQQLWNTRIVRGDFTLHPAYYAAAMLGEWYDGVSIFDAFVEEQRVINELCSRMGRPHFFKREYTGEHKPPEFGFLIRPTRHEFESFVHLLDKMLSDNINQDFFRHEVPYEQDVVRQSDGKTVVRQKGTIQILSDWLAAKYKPADRQPLDDMLTAMRRVRAARQRPAHAVDANRFDDAYLVQQREIMTDAYQAVNTLRQVLSHHPLAQGYEVPRWLDDGNIYTH